MGLIYDDPQLAALTLTRIAAEDSEGPTELTGRRHSVLDDLVQRNGAEYLAELVIVLARARFIVLDDLARATGASTAELLDAAEAMRWKVSMTASKPESWGGSMRSPRSSHGVEIRTDR